MNLTELHTELVNITRRTDKSDELKRLLRSVITATHESAEYPVDMVEETVEIANEATKIKFTAPARIRRMVQIMPVTVNGSIISLFSSEDNTYQMVDSAAALNTWYEQKADTYYHAGAAYVVNSSVAVKYLYLKYYQSPEVADDNLETWIMERYDQLILDWTLGRFWQRNGDESRGRALVNDVMQVQLPSLINNHCE